MIFLRSGGGGGGNPKTGRAPMTLSSCREPFKIYLERPYLWKVTLTLETQIWFLRDIKMSLPPLCMPPRPLQREWRETWYGIVVTVMCMFVYFEFYWVVSCYKNKPKQVKRETFVLYLDFASYRCIWNWCLLINCILNFA